MSLPCIQLAPVRRTCRVSRLACQCSTAPHVLAADLGGTNARYQLWSCPPGGAATLAFQSTHATAAHPSFQASLSAFLGEAGLGLPSAACFAVAGPVVEGSATLTNLRNWRVDGAELKEALATPAVRVVNDFEGVGYGILDLPASSLLTLNAAQPACVRSLLR